MVLSCVNFINWLLTPTTWGQCHWSCPSTLGVAIWYVTPMTRAELSSTDRHSVPDIRIVYAVCNSKRGHFRNCFRFFLCWTNSIVDHLFFRNYLVSFHVSMFKRILKYIYTTVCIRCFWLLNCLVHLSYFSNKGIIASFHLWIHHFSLNLFIIFICRTFYHFIMSRNL